MLLAIDTSTRYGGVALWKEGRATLSLCWHSTRNHTEELMPSIEFLLNKSGLKLQQLEGISVALGPGGFSALRVGLSTAKGLAMPLDLPLVGIGTLELEAYPFASTGLLIHSILDIGRGEIATASYKADSSGKAESMGKADSSGWTRLKDEYICQPDELLKSLTEPTILCGEGVALHQEALKDGLPAGSMLIPSNSAANRLLALARMSENKIADGEVDPIATLQPLYLRRPNIGQPKVLQRIQS